MRVRDQRVPVACGGTLLDRGQQLGRCNKVGLKPLPTRGLAIAEQLAAGRGEGRPAFLPNPASATRYFPKYFPTSKESFFFVAAGIFFRSVRIA